jgi:hypothetical protein
MSRAVPNARHCRKIRNDIDPRLILDHPTAKKSFTYVTLATTILHIYLDRSTLNLPDNYF